MFCKLVTSKMTIEMIIKANTMHLYQIFWFLKHTTI